MALPSLVRLCRPEQLYRFVAMDDFFQSTDGTFKTIGCCCDQEVSETISPIFGELPHEVVKSTAEIVNNVAEDGGEGSFEP